MTSEVVHWREDDASHWRIRLDDADAMRLDPIALELLQRGIESVVAALQSVPPEPPVEGTCVEVSAEELARRRGAPTALLEQGCPYPDPPPGEACPHCSYPCVDHAVAPARRA